MKVGDDIYEDQYHPTGRVIDIFNMVGDPIRKMNEADDVIKEEEESEAADDDDSSASPDQHRSGSGGQDQDSHRIGMLTNARDSRIVHD
jgi:hypothetical protein